MARLNLFHDEIFIPVNVSQRGFMSAVLLRMGHIASERIVFGVGSSAYGRLEKRTRIP